MTEEQVAAAVIARLATFNAAPYDLDDIPSPLPAYYNEVTVSRRFGGNVRAGRRASPHLYRVTVRAVAKNVSTAREMRRRASLIEGVTIDIGGRSSTPFALETSQPIGPDDGWWSGLTAYTFAL